MWGGGHGHVLVCICMQKKEMDQEQYLTDTVRVMENYNRQILVLLGVYNLEGCVH